MLHGFDEVVVVLTEADLGGGSGVSWLKKCILDKHANLALSSKTSKKAGAVG